MSECPFRLADYDSTDSTEIVYVFFFSYHINVVENLYVALQLSVALGTFLSLVNYRNNNFIKYVPRLSLYFYQSTRASIDRVGF